MNPIVANPIVAMKRDGRKENAAATQAKLRKTGRRLFGRLGYEATSVGMICAEAGVTTGALYHHFGDKKGLFAAVAEALDAGLVTLAEQARNQAVAGGQNPWQALHAAIDAFLAAGRDPEARRIGLTDAPAVLGGKGWSEIRERHGLGAMIKTVLALQAARYMTPGDPQRRARLILGLLYGAVEALPDDQLFVDEALADLRRGIHAMLDGLKA